MATRTITYSCELMTNFMAASLAAADRKFEALQTDTGTSLLFSITSGGSLQITREAEGSATGWERHDASASIAADFPGADWKVTDFAAAQNHATGRIDLIMAVRTKGGDRLYVSLGNAGDRAQWTHAPHWEPVPFDDSVHGPARVEIVNLFLRTPHDRTYIVVDVKRNPDDAIPIIRRYRLDPEGERGKRWISMDIASDIDASRISSCLGRSRNARSEGLYTLGQIGGHLSLMFQPFLNPFRPAIAASPIRLALPPDAHPTMLAAAAVQDDFTDLFVAGAQALYYFPHDRQKNDQSGYQVVENPILDGVSQLFAATAGENMVVWGRNRANEVFYLTCPLGSLLDPGAWSHPLPILEGVQNLSPYVNRRDDGNTFFAHLGGDRLVKAQQTPETLWDIDEILLPAAPTAKALDFTSYTTRLEVRDRQGEPAAGARIRLGATRRSGVYVNNVYTVLGPEPVPVRTDETGALTIVEPVSSLEATVLSVHEGRSTIHINPLDKPLGRVAALDSGEALDAATIQDARQPARPLVDVAASAQDKTRAAEAIGQLARTYAELPTIPGGSAGRVGTSGSGSGRVVSMSAIQLAATPPSDFADTIFVAAGDLWQVLRRAADFTIELVKDAAREAWHFMVQIGDKIYRAVIDSAAKIAGALEAVLTSIGATLADILDYARFLFEWQDFVRTKDVFKQLLKIAVADEIARLRSLKADYARLTRKAHSVLADWADLTRPDWEPALPQEATSMGAALPQPDQNQVTEAPNMMLFNHVKENLDRASNPVASKIPIHERALARLQEALQDEGKVLGEAVARLRSEIFERPDFLQLGIVEVLKKISAIVGIAMLDSSRVIFDLVVDTLTALAEMLVEFLDTPIRIPVVSDIIDHFAGEGTASFSLLDVIVMIGAIPATIVYKIAEGRAPFPEGNGFAARVKTATSLEELAGGKTTISAGTAIVTSVIALVAAGACLVDPASAIGPWPGLDTLCVLALPMAGGAGGKEARGDSFIPTLHDPQTRKGVYIVCRVIGGISGLMGAVLAAGSILARGATPADYERALTIAKVVTSVSIAIPLVLVPGLPIRNETMASMSKAVSGLALLATIGFGIIGYFTDDPVRKSALKKVSTGIDSLFAVLILIPTCYHIYELINAEGSYDRTEGLVEKVGTIFSSSARVATFVFALSETPEPVTIKWLGLSLAGYAGIQIALVFIEASRPITYEGDASMAPA